MSDQEASNKKALIPGGFHIQRRNIYDTALFTEHPPVWFKIWCIIYAGVNWKHGKPHGTLPRGSGFFSARAIEKQYSGQAKISRHQWSRCIRWLEEIGWIRTWQGYDKGLRIDVIGYNETEDLRNYKKPDAGDVAEDPDAPHTIGDCDASDW